MLVMYAAGVMWDAFEVVTGRWSHVASRTMTAFADAGSLSLWMQCVYYHRELARMLARQTPIAYVTVSASRNEVDARLA